jgi:hypothetical protein
MLALTQAVCAVLYPVDWNPWDFSSGFSSGSSANRACSASIVRT